MSGAAETAFSQAGAGFLLFVSLLSSFLLGALKPRECNWSWERATMTGEECSAHAWASSGSSVDYVALEQPYEDDGDRSNMRLGGTQVRPPVAIENGRWP